MITTYLNTTPPELPSIGSRIVWSANPDTVWIVDHHIPALNQFEAHLEGNPLEGARFDLDQLEGAEVSNS
jgi:hypothetical protein